MTRPPKAPRNRRPATTEAELLARSEDTLLPEDPRLADCGADSEEETGPLRRCLVTRERQPKERMIRFVLGPERMVVPDLAARLPGRGIWLSARRDVVETARAQGSLARAFAKHASRRGAKDTVADAASSLAGDAVKGGRGSVTLPPDLSGLIEVMLVRRVVELLGLARRAGQAVCGFQKAREWLTSNRAGLVLQASDGSVDERARFLSGVTAADPAGAGDARPDKGAPNKGAILVGSPLSAAALGAVFGRDHVVHVVVAPGRLAEALTNEIARLSGLKCWTEPGLKDAKAGPKAASGDAGTKRLPDDKPFD
jgi:predicted RNA-binding protein YlxR (DUF448 family)